MLPFRKLLCPTDFREEANQALEVASQMAQDFNAELLVLHVTEPLGRELGVEAYGVAGYDQDTLAIAQEHLSEVISESVPREVKSRGLARLGNAVEEIERTIKAEGADLLVIATRGLSGWRHLVFGSVTERTVRMSSCPVLAIHHIEVDSEAKAILPPRRILCPTDFSEPSREALSKASELAVHYGAKLGVLHTVWTMSDRLSTEEYETASYDRLKMSEAHGRLCELIAQETPAEAHAYPIVRLGNTAEQIERAAEEEEADLIVMATHGTTGWHHMFYGSIAEQVLRVTRHPIFVVHAPKIVGQ